MKAIKMIGLAALAALMAMAFVGASSAMAEGTALCASESEGCIAIQHVHETSVGKGKLLTSLGTTECNALFLGDTRSATGTPLVIDGNFTYSECNLGGASCTFTEENGPAEIKVLKEGHETAKVTGEYLVHLVCGASIDCSFNGTGLVGTAKGPLLSTQTNGEVTFSEQTLSKETGGFLCPKTSKWDITTTLDWLINIVSSLWPKYWCHDSKTKQGWYIGPKCEEKGIQEKELYIKEAI